MLGTVDSSAYDRIPAPSLRPTFARAHFHPLDGRMIVIDQAPQIASLNDHNVKGGVWKDAMPEDVAEYFRTAPLAQLQNAQTIPLDPLTGETQFTAAHKTRIPAYVRDFIDSVSVPFNEIGEWPAAFGIARHLEQKPDSIHFHSDTRPYAAERQIRGLITVSDEKEITHETEWLATDGLSEQQLHQMFGKKIPIEAFPASLQAHIQHVSQRDLFLAKSLGEQNNDFVKDACIHRAPPGKKDYSSQGIRRIGLCWERDIAPVYDLD